jgi:hypothetical protein
MSNDSKTEANDKPAERQSSRSEQNVEAKQRADVNSNVTSYTDHVKSQREEQKISGRSKATGAGADAHGKGGLASAKDLLGDLAHSTLTKTTETTPERKAQLMAEIERDGYIVGKPKQQDGVLIAQNWGDQIKQFGADTGEMALEKAGVFVHRGKEDSQVDYKAAQEAFKTAGLDKFGLPSNLIGAIMRNEQHYYKNTDADQDREVKEKGSVFKDGKEDLKASIGPAQIQIRNIKHLVELKNSDGKPEYPYLQHLKSDPLRGALDSKNAALLVAAYSNEVVKDLRAHGIQKPTAEQVIYLYNDDVNSYGTGKNKTFVSVSAPGAGSAEKLMHPDLHRERIPNDSRILEKSVHVRHVMHALEEVNKKFPLLEPSKAPGHEQDAPRQEKPRNTSADSNGQEFTV